MTDVRYDTVRRHYRIDTTDESIVLVEFDGAISDASLREYIQEMDAVIARRKRCAIVLDARRGGRPSSAQRALLAAWMREIDGVIRAHVSSYAYVIMNPLVRGALTAIFWLSPSPVPTRVFEDLASARRWSLEQFAIRMA